MGARLLSPTPRPLEFPFRSPARLTQVDPCSGRGFTWRVSDDADMRSTGVVSGDLPLKHLHTFKRLSSALQEKWQPRWPVAPIYDTYRTTAHPTSPTELESLADKLLEFEHVAAESWKTLFATNEDTKDIPRLQSSGLFRVTKSQQTIMPFGVLPTLKATLPIVTKVSIAEKQHCLWCQRLRFVPDHVDVSVTGDLFFLEKCIVADVKGTQRLLRRSYS
eukprot:TRINITY_DN3747_c0_g1_i1.p1 TRINITY_DN3747_c0_g1~~TRINITY_DN3747_c0_g1_i1.p1  ORF type:complete len:238 (+),score=19.22 TRINITY_DN3747_c0_g1_i1:58-714(+)